MEILKEGKKIRDFSRKEGRFGSSKRRKKNLEVPKLKKEGRNEELEILKEGCRIWDFLRKEGRF